MAGCKLGPEEMAVEPQMTARATMAFSSPAHGQVDLPESLRKPFPQSSREDAGLLL